MLIEQIIEFELKWLEPLGRIHVLQHLIIVIIKQNLLRKIFVQIIIYC